MRHVYVHHGGMDLTQPLSSLIPSVDGDVLTVLARTQAPLTGRRIASLARKGSRPAVQAVLDRLVDHGVVYAEPAGSARLYTLNRDHLLAESVGTAVAARDRLLIRLREHIEAWPIPAVHTSLFGSAARAEASARSDLDVVVIRPDEVDADSPAWTKQLADLADLVTRWTGNTLSWFEVDRTGLARGIREGEAVLGSVRSEGIHLTGTRFATLVHETVVAQ